MNIAPSIIEFAKARLDMPADWTWSESEGFTLLATGGGFDYVCGRFGTTELIFADAEDAGSPWLESDEDDADHLNAPTDVVLYFDVPDAANWEESSSYVCVRFDTCREAMDAVAAMGDNFDAPAFIAAHGARLIENY